MQWATVEAQANVGNRLAVSDDAVRHTDRDCDETRELEPAAWNLADVVTEPAPARCTGNAATGDWA